MEVRGEQDILEHKSSLQKSLKMLFNKQKRVEINLTGNFPVNEKLFL